MNRVESVLAARAALQLALSPGREAEKKLKEKYLGEGIRATAVDYGGEFINSLQKVLERAVVAAKREGIVDETHLGEGAVAGAAREALSQVMPKAIGLNVGAKWALQEKAIMLQWQYFCHRSLHLNEVCVGLGHRAI